MKKIFISMLMMAIGLVANAQTVEEAVEFIDGTSAPLESGAIIPCTDISHDEGNKYFWIWPQIYMKRKIENVPLKVTYTLKNISAENGLISFSDFGSDAEEQYGSEAGFTRSYFYTFKPRDMRKRLFYVIYYIGKRIAADDVQFTGKDYGQAEVEITIEKVDEANKVIPEAGKINLTLTFNIDVTNGIDNALNNNGQNVKEVARYNANGQLINAPAKGVNIVKLNNGKVIKQVVK